MRTWLISYYSGMHQGPPWCWQDHAADRRINAELAMYYPAPRRNEFTPTPLWFWTEPRASTFFGDTP